MTQLIDTRVELLPGESPTQRLVIKKTQDITPEFIDRLRDSRLESSNQRTGHFHHVASIPTIFVEQWMREGFDISKATAKEIAKKLRDSNLGAFLATNKRL